MVKSLERLDKVIQSTEERLTELKDIRELITKEISKFEEKVKSLEKELKTASEKDIKISELESENKKLKNEIDDINAQLNKISKLYQEVSHKKEEAINVRQLLSIYVILLEEVFYGRPHAKILFLLHGDNQSLTREAITKSTGFQPAIVLHSIHDLHNAGLVEYDNEKDVVTLKKRIY
ncbi:MAG: hypothetical protein ACTSQY_06725 [Candidatus Odinarchaeia archaeon]